MYRLIIATLLSLLIVTPALAEVPKTENEKTLYAVGLMVARSLGVFSLTPQELEFVKEGMTDGVTGKKPAVDISAYSGKVQELARDRRKLQGEKAASAGDAYLAKAAREKGAVKTESGMVYRSLREGTGPTPAATDTVKVNYRGTLIDGTEFDSSYKRGQPAEFQLNQVVKCWTEGVQKMKVGGKAELVCPAALAYGDNGAGEMIPPGATLVFDVELLDIVKK